MGLENFIQNNKAWKEEQLRDNPTFFEDLAKGQKPSTLLIGCSDSRVSPSTLLGSKPGEIFIHRNIANQAKMDDPNFLAILDYSLNVLMVDDIIVKGHYGCGGVAAAAKSVEEDKGRIYDWVNPVVNLYKQHAEIHHLEEEEKLNKLVALNVLQQMENIRETACFKRRQASVHPVGLHGWIFDIHSGEIIRLMEDGIPVNRKEVAAL